MRLYHSLGDDVVPWQNCLHTSAAAKHDDVHMTLVKEPGHRMSRDYDKRWISQIIAELAGKEKSNLASPSRNA